jgi:Zn-dependent peptidase ImmA (M78 family)
VEKRANAFAAMILMPRSVLQTHIAGLTTPLDDPEGFAAMAKSLGVSYTSMAHHLENLGILDAEATAILLSKAGVYETDTMN